MGLDKPRGLGLGDMWSKYKEWVLPVATAGAGIMGGGGAAVMGVSQLAIKGLAKLDEQYTDSQRQPYMENPERNAWDTQIQNNQNRLHHKKGPAY